MSVPPSSLLGASARYKATVARRRIRHFRRIARMRILGASRPEVAYRAWVSEIGRSGSSTGGGLQGTPRITIIMAVHDPPIAFLRQALESVNRQTLPVHELILTDDGSQDPRVRALLSQAAGGPNVKLVSSPSSPSSNGIVRALNAALPAVTGDYVGVLDHDDQLHPRANEVMQRHLTAHPSDDLVYSDEDKITSAGDHFDPYFKPDYSPEMLLTSMYLNHFTTMRTSTVREVGGFREGTDGAQDHDLALRMIRAGATVSHVPAVLYHWRAWPGSTAAGINAKPWAQKAAADVQRAHLDAIGHPGVVQPSSVAGLNEVHPGIRGEPLVSIVVPTISRPISADSALTLVEQCLRSIRRDGGWGNVELVVVHTNQPDPGQRKVIELLADRVVTYSTVAFNFSEACNLGVRAATGDYVLLLNDDTQVRRPGAICAMLEFAQLDGVGAVGARLTYPDGRNQHSGILFVDGQPTHPHHGAPASEAGYFGSVITPRNYLAVTGAALMTPRALFASLEGLDPGWPREYQDIDYCLRLGEAGYRIVYTPYAQFTHIENASLERLAPDPADTALFLSRWGRGRAGNDPYYSPLLDQRTENLFSPR